MSISSRLLLAVAFLFAGVARADIFLVTHGGDSGAGSLRQAIEDANLHPNGDQPDEIHFAIPGAGVQSIRPLTPLPIINDAVVIDGFTQPGSVRNTNPVTAGLNARLLIELDGDYLAYFENYSLGLRVETINTTVRGLIINRFYTGIICQRGGGHTFTGNYIGSDAEGATAPRLYFTHDRQRVGVLLQDSRGCRIGGRIPAERNLISGHTLSDVMAAGLGAKENVVEGNLLGTTASGTEALLAVNDRGSTCGVYLNAGASFNVIGGTAESARNVISGISAFGVRSGVRIDSDFRSPLPADNRVQGNYIGLDVTGTAFIDTTLFPTGRGIFMSGDRNLIGGREPGARNVISGNGWAGITLGWDGGRDNIIEGNFFGTDWTGTKPVGSNRYGVEVRGKAINNIIGGTAPGAGNVIAFSSSHAVVMYYMQPGFGTGNAVLGNSFFTNRGLGLDINDDGVTPNDPGDLDEGINRLQNSPVLESAEYVPGGIRLRGSVDSSANTSYRLEFFGDATLDESRNGDARVFLGVLNVHADENGRAAFDVTWRAPAKTRMTSATATDPDNNTSEFSAAKRVAGSAPAELHNISARGQVLAGDNVLIAGMITGGPEPKRVMLRAIGPSLTAFGVQAALPDPTLSLYDETGRVVASNDNWRAAQEAEIRATGLAPSHHLEAALIANLQPARSYTAVVSAGTSAGGIALVEAYDVEQATYASLRNLSTRAPIGMADEVLIGGVILGGSSARGRVIVRAIGPSLTAYGVTGALSDPVLELRDANGELVAANDNWRDSQADEITATQLAPDDLAEAAIVISRQPGPMTAIVRGKHGATGIGLVELYDLN